MAIISLNNGRESHEMKMNNKSSKMPIFSCLDVARKALIHERGYFRQETRVQAWDEYVLVSILCTSISFSALLSFQLNLDHQGMVFYEILKIGIYVFAGLSVQAGLYSTMVFSLSILYARTALGMERDPQYASFIDNTEGIRLKGFRAFSLSLFSFSILVILIMIEQLPWVVNFPLGSLMAVALFFVGVRDWMVLVDEASGIFSISDTGTYTDTDD